MCGSMGNWRRSRRQRRPLLCAHGLQACCSSCCVSQSEIARPLYGDASGVESTRPLHDRTQPFRDTKTPRGRMHVRLSALRSLLDGWFELDGTAESLG